MTAGTPQQRPLIGVAIPWPGGADHLKIVDGFSRSVRAHGYDVLILYSGAAEVDGFFDNLLTDSPNAIAGERCVGWMTTNVAGLDQWVLEKTRHGRPVVQVSPVTALPGCQRVVPDNIGGAQAAVEHLISHGHQRIAFIGHLANRDIAERYQGYLRALAANGLSALPELISPIDWRSDFWSALAGSEATQRLLALPDQPFSAIFAATDELAFGGLTALERVHLRVPEQIALIGFDDVEQTRTSNPPLTTVRQSFHALGIRAAELLLAQLAGNPEAGDTHAVPIQLVVRSSCGCPPTYARLPETTLSVALHGNTFQRPVLLAAMIASLFGVIGSDATHEYEAASTILDSFVDQFEQALDHDATTAWVAALDRTLLQLTQLVGEASQVLAALRVLRKAAHALPDDRQQRAERLLDIAEGATADVFVRMTYAQTSQRSHASHAALMLLFELLKQNQAPLLELRWAAETPLSQAYLLLYETTAADRQQLRLMGTYARDGSPRLLADAIYNPAEFPPAALTTTSEELLAVFPLCTASRLYGVLCTVTPFAYAVANSDTSLWAAELAAQLELYQAMTRIKESHDTLQAVYAQERSLMQTVLDLSCPVMRIAEGVLILPLIGSINAMRAEKIVESLLIGITEDQASVVVIDITGVPLVDTQIAHYLIRATQAARLLGSEVVFTGIRPEIAQTIVQLGIDISDFVSRADLESGLRYALARRRNI